MSFFIFAVIYFSVIIGISFITSRKETREEFLIGGKKLGALSLAISLSTSWISSGWLVLLIYFVINDLPAFLFLILGSFCNLILLSFFVKKPYELAKKNNWITMTEMVRGMLGVKSGAFVLVFVFILFSMWFLFELIGGGLILSTITFMSYPQSVILICTIVCVYLCLGGFKSLIQTDLIQYSLMGFILVSCLYLAKDVEAIDIGSYIKGKESLSVHGFLAGFFGFFALQFSESTIWQRILAAKSANDARKALILTSGISLFNYFILTMLVILGVSLFPNVQDAQLYALIAQQLPFWLAPLFLVSILALIMSTLDTILFISAQCFSTDSAFLLGKRLKKPRCFMKLSMVAFAIIMSIVSLLIQDIEAVFWFLVALWVSLTPICYMFLPFSKPSDESIVMSMIVLATIIAGLHMAGKYQDYYVFYIFVSGIIIPPVFERFKNRFLKVS